MPSKAVYTEVKGRKLKLTNLDKILYPGAGILKAEVIQYYLAAAQYILPFIKSRPLSFVRYPNGIQAHKFFQKDRPDWTPTWIKSMRMSSKEDEKNYIMAEEEAALVWMAQMACLEIHCMQIDKNNPTNPDYFVFDLDPPDDKNFTQVKEIAFLLKDFLESKDYTPYIKTSGGKGAHIICPIIPELELAVVMESIKELAAEFQAAHKSITTLHIKKEARKGRMLLDIYRNHRSQTTVTILSTRGKPGAPVSMPLSWKAFEDVTASNQFNISNALEFIEKNGVAWDGWRNKEIQLHTHRSTIKPKAAKAKSIKAEDNVALEDYNSKRDFTKTSEPSADTNFDLENQFVVQLHDASTLHFDLRLQADGVLHSWAIPKGLPQKANVKRLAIQTEPHPLKYLDFEGTIPKDEYGGGEMWVFSRGDFETIKRTKKKWTFRLNSKNLSGEFIIYKMKDDQWLLERKDKNGLKLHENIPRPMLADVTKKLPTKGEYLYEIKWDGIRTLIVIEGDEMKIISRSGRDITDKFPELVEDIKLLKTSAGIFDGEIVCVDEQGRPDFAKVISRMHSTGMRAIKTKSKKSPVYCYLFDVLFMGGRSVTNEPLFKRQEWLNTVVNPKGHFRCSEAIEDGAGLLKAAEAMQLEGIMVKDKYGLYEPGRRTKHWQKLKFRNTKDYYILGYTKGEGDRSALYGALHLAEKEGEDWIYRGKVGSGFDEKKMIAILSLLKEKKEVKKYIKDKIEEASKTTWIEPGLACEIQYASMTKNGTLREPVFLRMREDLYF